MPVLMHHLNRCSHSNGRVPVGPKYFCECPTSRLIRPCSGCYSKAAVFTPVLSPRRVRYHLQRFFNHGSHGAVLGSAASYLLLTAGFSISQNRLVPDYCLEIHKSHSLCTFSKNCSVYHVLYKWIMWKSYSSRSSGTVLSLIWPAVYLHYHH